jgi:stearoyl-CoA desaturase (delta-9 desaturase)
MILLWQHRILLLAVLLSIPFGIWYSVESGNLMLVILSLLLTQVHKLIGNAISFHRYFSHRSFKTTKFKHKLLAYWTILLAAKSPIAYALNHRHHHLYADTDKDTHSPTKSFWHTITGAWEFRGYQWFVNKGVEFRIRDLLRDPDLKFIEAHYFKFWTAIILVSLLIDWRLLVFGFLMPAGFFHLLVNVALSFEHLKLPSSYRTYETPDNSYNNVPLHWATLGEGLHNNHHKDPTNYNQAHKENEFDICAWVVEKFFIEHDEKKIYKF